jgi:hypothetical protein
MKLKDWLIFKCISVPKFCKYNDFCEESIYSYIKGGVPRSNIALKIVKATGGEVSLEDLGLDSQTIEKIRVKQQKIKEKKEREKASRAAKARETSEAALLAVVETAS